MKKINIITLSLFLSIFLLGFIVSYKSKIRKSIVIFINSLIVTLLSINAKAKSNGLKSVNDSILPAHLCLTNKSSRLLNKPKPQNQNLGSNKLGGNVNNNNDNNSNFEPECIDNSKPDNPYHY